MGRHRSGVAVALLAAVAAIVAVACGGEEAETFHIAGIPDQNATKLARRYQALTSYLSEELGVPVEYVPTVNYAATVEAFKRGDIQMAWFGGLTGVQARLATPGSEAIAQRPRDEQFHSVFIVRSDLEVDNLEDLKGLRFTFGSESSTSGHLMPRHFLLKAGVDPETDFRGKPNFSGSHDKTWKLVESGAFQAGALNEAVWASAVAEGRVDTTKVRVLSTSPPYFDYNWTIRGDVDSSFRAGFGDAVKSALLAIGDGEQEVLDMFSTDRFVASDNGNYQAILDVARSLGIVE